MATSEIPAQADVPVVAVDTDLAVPTPIRRQPVVKPPLNMQQLLETRVSVIREGDNVMLRLPSDVIRVVTVQKEG
jgi:hypothetical protein